jgi:hypothetical protein
MKYSELIAIENLIQNGLHDVNKALGIGRLNDGLEVNKEPKHGSLKITEDRISFGIVGDQLFKFWAQMLASAIQIIKELVYQNLAKDEDLEILQEQIKTLTDELIAENQKVGFWQEEVEFCHKEIEALNIELCNYTQLLESQPLEADGEPGIPSSPTVQQQLAKIRQNFEPSNALPRAVSKTVKKRKFFYRKTSAF